ncbi:MAG: transcriptional regulator, TetR family [Solirubrobacterales bacterium]|nr:transcriptional regulator, TetR family [Solirubrobacterales bacterium]
MEAGTGRLDVPAVVAASLAIADADGLENLSMRRLASRLSVTPMAIYHHVRDKGELLDLMADESLRALPPLVASAPWDSALEDLFLGFHRLYLAHPALAQIMTQRPLEGPHAIAVGEQVLTVLSAAGIDDDTAASAFISIVNYTIGASLYRTSRSSSRLPERRRFGRISAADAPRAHGLRQTMAALAVDEGQFLDGLRRLLASYRMDAAAAPARPTTARAPAG